MAMPSPAPSPTPSVPLVLTSDRAEPAAPDRPVGLIVTTIGAGVSEVAEKLRRPGLPGDVPVLVLKRPPAGRYERVLVGVDLSAGSADCVRTAMALAPGARCTAVHLVPPTVAGAAARGNGDRHLAQVRRRILADAERRMDQRLAGVEGVEKAVGPGVPEQVLNDLPRLFGFDLVVLGAGHGRSLRRLVRGSITEPVVESAPCDVLIVPRRRGRPSRAGR